MVLPERIGSLLGKDPIVVLDGGARNGTFELPGLARYVHVYGFEPNREEYEKLLTGKTDVYKASGVRPPPYAKAVFLPTALAHFSGVRPLHVTKGPGSCSLMEPNQAVTSQYEQGWAWNFEISGSIQVDCSTLEQVLRGNGIDWVDYIKLDTQGNEYDILFASEWARDRISVIKTEVEFIEMYRGQRLFTDIDSGLRAAGFHFIDLAVTHEHRIGRGNLSVSRGKRELLWGDAYYARRFDEREAHANPVRVLKQALVLMELGYIEYGLFMLQRANIATLPLAEIRDYYKSERRHWKRFIPVPLKTAARIALRAISG